jgi:hypothetical protein
MKWIIEKHLFDYATRLAETIRAYGDQAFIINFDPDPNEAIAAAERKHGADFFKKAIIHGSTRLAVETPLHSQFWGSGEIFSVSKYMPILGPLMLNPTPIACAWSELPAKTLGLGEKFFVRPDVPWKVFSGKVLTRETLGPWYQTEGALRNIPPNTPCQISTFQPLEKEWRVIVIDRQPVTCSRYGSSAFETDERENEVLAFATKAASYAETLTVDVCLTQGQFKIVEVGNLNTCDWYASDLQKVVPALSKYASRIFS